MLSFYRLHFMYHLNKTAEDRSEHFWLALLTDKMQL
jgi:hypothetical protein